MSRAAMFLASILLPLAAHAQDAVKTDGDKYKVLIENDRMRLLEYRDRPGEKTHQHHHPAFTLYALSAFKRSITLPDGKVIKREFKPGDVMNSDAQTHIGENIGDTETHALLFEQK